MGDQQRGTSLQETANSFLNLVLGRAVNGTGRIIQDQDTRVGEQGTRNRNTLALPPGERDATLSNDGLVALLKTGDKGVCLGILRGLFNSWLVCLLAQAIGDVLRDGTREEEDILLNGGDLGTEPVQTPLAHIYTIEEYTAIINIVDTVDEFSERAFACACLADNGDSLSWFCMERDIFQGDSSAIAKGNMLENDIATHHLMITALILVQFGLLF